MGHLGHMKCLLSCNTLQGGLDACEIGQDVGKENVDPAPPPKHPRMARVKKVSTVILPKYECVLVQFAQGLPNFDASDTEIDCYALLST